LTAPGPRGEVDAAGGLCWVFGVWAITRLVLLIAVYCAQIQLPVKASELPLWDAFPGNPVLNGWVRWDSGWYAAIADRGYPDPEQIVQGQPRSTAFFPAYPLLIRIVAIPVGDVHLAGLMIANVAFLLAVLLLYQMVAVSNGVPVARRTILLLLLFPFSFFFSAVYTESLFLLAAVAAFYFGQRRAWLLAGLFAALAGATRQAGVLVVAGLALLYLEQSSFDWRRPKAGAWWILLGLAGPLAYMGFLIARHGDPFEFVAAQRAWGTLRYRPHHVGDVLNYASALLAAVICLRSWSILPKSMTLWAAGMTLVGLTRLTSMGRLSAVVFPLFIAAALLLEDRRKLRVILSVSAALLLVSAIRFSLWHWVA